MLQLRLPAALAAVVRELNRTVARARLCASSFARHTVAACVREIFGAAPMAFKRFAVFLLCSLCAGHWPSASGSPEEVLPVVEVSLVSPAEPLPAVSAQIGGLDRAREAAEAEGIANAHRGFNEAARKASLRIAGLTERATRIFEASLMAHEQPSDARALSFASVSDGSGAGGSQPVAVAVEVAQASQPDSSVTEPLLGALEAELAEKEGSLFESTAKGFDDITDIVLAETLAQVQSLADSVATLPSNGGAGFSQAGFLAGEQPPQQANVRVVAPEVPYPTVASLAQDMEVRRSISSGLVRARLLELELSLLKRENAMVRSALGDASKRLVAQLLSTRS